MSPPLSEVGRAIRTLDERYGADGWVVRESIFGDGYLVSIRPLWVDGACQGTASRGKPTARDAILAAAERVQAETPTRSAA